MCEFNLAFGIESKKWIVAGLTLAESLEELIRLLPASHFAFSDKVVTGVPLLQIDCFVQIGQYICDDVAQRPWTSMRSCFQLHHTALRVLNLVHIAAATWFQTKDGCIRLPSRIEGNLVHIQFDRPQQAPQHLVEDPVYCTLATRGWD